VAYSLAGLAQARQETLAPLTFTFPPQDAPDRSTGILAAWNGEAFVDWAEWQATCPLQVEAIPAGLWMGGEKYVAPGYTLVKDGERWLLRHGKKLVPGFVSAFLSHAIRWAEELRGIPAAAWMAAE
jgi:hypothetical protein